ncbi:MAG: hypothetical protein ACOCV2_05390 [Persicimonas sp.]
MMRHANWLVVLVICLGVVACTEDKPTASNAPGDDAGADAEVEDDAGDAEQSDADNDADPGERCDETGECSEEGDLCSELREASDDRVEAYCTEPDEEAPAEIGESCQAAEDCREGLCLEGQSDECSVVCVEDEQCGDGQVCTTLDVDASTLGFCMTECQTHGDCADLDYEEDGEEVEHVCTVHYNEREEHYDQICVQRETVDEDDPEAGRLGDECPEGDNTACQSGMCLETAIFDGTACDDDTDCDDDQVCEENADGRSECADLEFRCSRLCENNGDCQEGVEGNELISCDSDVTIDGSQTVSMCTMPR